MHAYHFDSHALFRFSSQEDADAFDPNDAYACLMIGRDQYMTSWMSFGACQELHEFVNAQTATPPFYDCVIRRAWSCTPFQDALDGDAEVHAPTGTPMACKRRFRLPMAVLFWYSGVGSSLCMPGCLQVRVPNTERAPVSVVFDHRTMSCLPTTLSTTIPGPTTWVLPVVQAPHEERLVVPMHGLCFLAAMMDCMDVTGAGIRNRCSMEYFPLKVVPLKTHTLVMPMQRLTWEALTCAREGFVLPRRPVCDLVVSVAHVHTTHRTVVVTQIYMNFIRTFNGSGGYLMNFDYTLPTVSCCTGAFAVSHDSSRVKVPYYLLRPTFDFAHKYYICVNGYRLAWLSACARAGRAMPGHAAFFDRLLRD